MIKNSWHTKSIDEISAHFATNLSMGLSSEIIAQRLSAVETMDCLQVICTDKTGTLTVGQMTLREIFHTGEISMAKCLTWIILGCIPLLILESLKFFQQKWKD